MYYGPEGGTEPLGTKLNFCAVLERVIKDSMQEHTKPVAPDGYADGTDREAHLNSSSVRNPFFNA